MLAGLDTTGWLQSSVVSGGGKEEEEEKEEKVEKETGGEGWHPTAQLNECNLKC